MTRRRFRVYLAARYDRRQDMVTFAREMIWGTPRCLAHCEWISGSHDDMSPQDCALVDLREIRNCDILVHFCEEDRSRYNSGGRHVEVGYALALNKPVILVGTPENIFHHLPQITLVPNADAALEALNDWSEKCLIDER